MSIEKAIFSVRQIRSRYCISIYHRSTPIYPTKLWIKTVKTWLWCFWTGLKYLKRTRKLQGRSGYAHEKAIVQTSCSATSCFSRNKTDFKERWYYGNRPFVMIQRAMRRWWRLAFHLHTNSMLVNGVLMISAISRVWKFHVFKTVVWTPIAVYQTYSFS